MRIITKQEKEKIIESLKYYGINEVPLVLIETSPGRIRGYSGEINEEDIKNIGEIATIEVAGLYMFNNFDGEIRLSIDAIHLLKGQITKNIIEIDDKEAEEWMKGQDLILTDELKQRLKKEEKGFKIIKNKEDFLGCCKLLDNRIVNYLPKERREKIKTS
jgi:NOL1/NOP2/fmu family ribosome biogenesis protein